MTIRPSHKRERSKGIVKHHFSIFDSLSTGVGIVNHTSVKYRSETMTSEDDEQIQRKKRSKKKSKRSKKKQSRNHGGSYDPVEVNDEEAPSVLPKSHETPPSNPVVPYPEIEQEYGELTSNGNSLPNPPVVHKRAFLNTCRERSRSNCCTLNRFLFFVFVLIVVIIIFSAGVEYEEYHNHPIIQDAGAEQDGGSYSPETPTGVHYDERQLGLIKEMKRLSGSVISTPRTPHHKAAHWMLWIDKSGIMPDSPFLWQRYVVALFYYKIDGDSDFFVLDENSNECTWDRIQCDSNGFIHHLSFDNCDLTGPIPSKEIQALTKLKYLDLSSNYLTGIIPKELQVLTQIEKLFLDDNDLEGQMPPEICAQTSSGTLTTLTADCSPDDLKVDCDCCTNCAKLPSDLLTGLTSNQADVYNMMKGLSGHDLISDMSRPQFRAAQWILKQDSMTTDNDYPFLLQRYVFATLYYMMHSNDKCFQLQPENSECDWVSKPLNGTSWNRIVCDDQGAVKYLKLNDCSLTGKIPSDLQALSSLHYLDLSDNFLTGMVPLSFINLHFLGNDIGGVIPTEICSKQQAEHNFLQSFKTDCEDDSSKVSCSCCTNCQTNTGDTSGNGGGLSQADLDILEKLAVLSGPSVHITSTPQHKSAHWIIKEDEMQLTVDSDHLIQRYIISLLYELSDGQCIQRISGVDECQWKAIHPDESTWDRIHCSTSGMIEDLELGGCQLSGQIPRELQGLSDLNYLDLSNNMFSGVIPGELFKSFESLRLLYFHKNQLEGSMPNEICQMHEESQLIKLTADCAGNNTNPHFVQCSCCTNCLLPSQFLVEKPVPLSLQDNITEVANETRIDQITDAIRNISPVAITDQFSPQHLAMNWMLSEDKLVSLDPASFRFTQRFVMVVLFFSIGNEDLQNFLILRYQDVCSVSGIQCNSSGRITKLEFPDSGLMGNLPKEVHFLSDLKRVDLSYNSISGSVPTQWGGLTKLEYLDLRSTDMHGSFPPQLCYSQESNGQIFKVDCSKVTCSCCVDCRY